MTGPVAVPPLQPSHDVGVTDQEIFGQLYPGLRRFAAVVGAVEVDPDDLVQDAVAHALVGGSLSRFDSPGAYLRQAIVNAASNDRRRAGRRRRALTRLGGGLTEAQPSVYPSDITQLARFSPTIRALIYLRVIDGLAYDEIASILGVSSSSARMTLSRALRSIRSSGLDTPSPKDHHE